jgi:hypothetical protein
VERTVASSAYKPAGQPEIRKANHVIRVQVCEEHAIHVLPADPELSEALQGAAACIEQELLSTRFDESARPEPVHDGRRRSGSE